jgi:trk system potassium uptake protein
MPTLTGPVTKYPARASFIWYLGVILLGTAALTHPLCRAEGKAPLTFVDSLFTSTSATCVTGLAVRSTEHDLSFVGQLVLLALIQLGGIGIMTVTTFIMVRAGGRANLRQRVLISETLGARDSTDLNWVLRSVIVTTVLIEGAGFLLLLGRNVWDMPLAMAAWHALFHSVSAFCNAGFGLFDDSLTRYQGDVFVNLVICTLVILGGLGFPVLMDLRRQWQNSWRGIWERLHVHSKLMLLGTSVLLVVGTVSVLLLEWDGVLAEMSLPQRFLAAFFHSASTRTAGFNTVSIGHLTNATLFITIALMAIGAGPCSTAGGFKVSTITVLVLRAWGTFRGRERVNILLFAVVLILALTVLLVYEQSGSSHQVTKGLFLEAMFEVTSALGTVGLSTGLTATLSVAGKIIIIALMFLGRLGPISVFAALSGKAKEEPVQYPSEEPMIG